MDAMNLIASLRRNDLIEMFEMERHPVAGWLSLHYEERAQGGHSAVSSMYYLLDGDEPLPAHKVHGVEIWHFCIGAPAEIVISTSGASSQVELIGNDLVAGQRPQLAVPPYSWQSCRSLGAWTLFGRTMSPGFSTRSAVVLSSDQ